MPTRLRIRIVRITAIKVRPKIVAEIDDPALARIAGERGVGVFATPDVVAEEVRDRHKVQLISAVEEARQRLFAISVERKTRHPAVLAITNAARKSIFA
jgi:LysR family transcriptional activator of nhaA